MMRSALVLLSLVAGVGACAELLSLRQFLDDYKAKKEIPTLLEKLGVPWDAKVEPFSSVATSGDADVIRVKVETQYVLSLDKNTGKLRTFAYTGTESIPPDSTEEDAITRERAISEASEFMEVLGLKPNLDDSHVTYVPGIGPGRLEKAFWLLFYFDKINNVRSNSGTGIKVSAYSGKVIFFSYTPKLDVEKAVQKLTPVDAIKRASEFAKQKGIEIQGSGKPPELTVVRPDNSLTREKNVSYERKKTGRLAWKVLLNRTDREPLLVYVDAETGKIVGGSL